MAQSRVQEWFGPRFSALHPLLQQLHLQGGRLTGDVDVDIPRGFAGFVGRRLARKLGVPTRSGPHALCVSISHQADGMHWDRCFDGIHNMRSLFRPIGTLPAGYWVEDTGPLQMRLTVDVQDGGWYWRCLEMRWLGCRLPLWLFPNSRAFKTVENGRYVFYVGFSLPWLGKVLSYSGTLEPQTFGGVAGCPRPG